MPPKIQKDQAAGEKKQERRQFDVEITKQVLNALGYPEDLQRIQVRSLWDNHYRVNVLIGPDVSTVRVAHSFFLVVDQEGVIITSTPKITKEFAPKIDAVAQ